jgi:putative transposase
MNKFKSNNNIVFDCKYHVIWCPKYRRKVLIGDVEKRLKEILIDVALDTRCEIIEMETDVNHIHILVSVDPQFGIMKFIKRAKGRSSNLLRKEFKHLRTKLPTLWTNSTLVSSVGSVSLEVVKKYIENQQTSQRPKAKQKWEDYLKDVN